ncbi:MAG: hypothetical protein WKF78_00090 [Candidatus Limnocylindrales bacterium]
MLVLLDAGLRLSELASLRFGDVRPDGMLQVMGKIGWLGRGRILNLRSPDVTNVA